MRTTVARNLSGLLLRLAVLCGAALSPAAANAFSLDASSEDSFLIRAEVKEWASAGSIRYRVAAETAAGSWTPAQTGIFMGRTMDYRDMSAALPLFSAEVRPVKGIAMDFEVGDSRSSDGHAFIHSWMDGWHKVLAFNNGSTWISPDHQAYSKATARLSGTTRLYSADVYFHLFKTGVRALRDDYDLQHSLELFAGYSWYQDRVRIREGRTVLSDAVIATVPPLGPVAGLDSRFSMTWQGWRVGFRERTRLSKACAFNAKFAFGPTMAYKGTGYWNVNNFSYGNVGSSRVRHNVTGQVLELSASAEWNFWKSFQLNAGYMGWFYRLTSGKQKTYYPDGTESEEQITEFDAARKGLFASLSWKF